MIEAFVLLLGLSTGSDPTGIWLGSLDIGGNSLRLAFHLQRDADVDWTGTIDSLDQNVKGTKLSRVDIDDDGSVFIRIDAFSARFEGKFEGEPPKIVGTFTQNGHEVPLTLEHVDKVEGPKRPQEPKPPFPYRVEEVEYDSVAKGVELAATLTLPEGAGPFPAVVLITGSGAQDRDETLLGHKPFAVLADAMTRRGIAVLRADDRGTAASTGTFSTATSFDFTDDAEGGVRYLKSRKEIDPKKIGLMGHSEGGLIAPILAARCADVAFIVMLAGPGVPGDEILRMQSRLIAKAGGAKDEEIDAGLALNEKLYSIIKREPVGPKLTAKLVALIDAEKERADPAHQKDYDEVKAGLAEITSPWMKAFLAYDPRENLVKVKCPVLAINGGLDLQVPPKEDLAEIEKALRAAGNADFTVQELPGLNHLFQPTETGSPAEYSKIETTFDPAALTLIGDWITKRFVEPR